MSHELRTPMNGVVGMTELLTRTALSATQSHLTKTIRSSAQILLQIVNDLLDLSKIRAGKVALEKLPIDLAQVLEECTSMFAGTADNKGIELIVCPPAPSQTDAARRPAAPSPGADESRRQRREIHRARRSRRARGRRARRRRARLDPKARPCGSPSPTPASAWTRPRWTRSSSRSRKPTRPRRAASAARAWDSRFAASSPTSWAAPLPSRASRASAPRSGCRCRSRSATRSCAALAPLPSRSVRIVTRRPSLAESVARHAAALGLDVLTGRARHGRGRRRRRRRDHSPEHAELPARVGRRVAAGARRHRNVGRRRVARVAVAAAGETDRLEAGPRHGVARSVRLALLGRARSVPEPPGTRVARGERPAEGARAARRGRGSECRRRRGLSRGARLHGDLGRRAARKPSRAPPRSTST